MAVAEATRKQPDDRAGSLPMTSSHLLIPPTCLREVLEQSLELGASAQTLTFLL
jgi:hypothetical protein